MDDLSKDLNQAMIGCRMNGVLCNHLMYADDTCIIAPAPSAMYKLLKICTEFAKNNSIVFNHTKSKYLCFKPKSLLNLYVPDMYFNGEVLTSVTCTKYLGVVIDSSAQDNVDILRHVRAIYTRGNMLISRFKICTDEVKLCLFRSYLSSIYGGQLWTNFKSNVFKKAVVAYNNVYRKFFNIRRGPSMSAIYVNSGIDHFNVLVRKNLGSFRQRLLNCDKMHLFLVL
jgi:hypothetical protein